jgi:inosine-uridine nucleoside N-ribohydrolase
VKNCYEHKRCFHPIIFNLVGALLLMAAFRLSAAVNVLVDTDIGPDCDDAGAVCILHNMANNGEVVILGMACCTSSEWGAPCLDAINTYFGRPNIPVGTYKQPGFLTWSSYNQDIATHWPNRIKNGTNAPDAVTLYRQILSQQPNQSVVFVAIGPLNNLADLLQSPPDGYSSLNGHDLVAAKVKMLADMGGAYTSGTEFNFQGNAAATQNVFTNWPTPIMCSGFEIGNGITSGSVLSTQTPSDNPIRRAYADLVGVGKGQSSWDLTAMLYAVRGLSNYWSSSASGSITINSTGGDVFTNSVNKNQTYLIAKMAPSQLGSLFDTKMVGTLKNGGQVIQTLFSPAQGSYGGTVIVNVSTTTPGATIYYTLDGSNPSASNGTVYAGPVSISGSSVTLKAIAIKNGMGDSDIISGTYSIAQPPFFISINQYNNMINLSWAAVVGQSYQLQTSTNPGPIGWTNLGSFYIATNTIMTVSETGTFVPAQYYRVLLMP